MIYINAFLLCGSICAIGQYILEKTTLTPGHLNTIFVVAGVVLSGTGVYEKLIKFAGAGATVPITNFGHLLFTGAMTGFKANGITGILNGLLINSSGGLCITVILAIIVALIFKPKH